MVIYGSILIAMLAVLVLYIRFRKHVAWWEYMLPLAGAVIPALIIKMVFSFGLSSDTEWWTGNIERIEFYEKWNEKVVYYDTEYYTDSNGDRQSRQVRKTRIDTHYPKWYLEDSNGIEKSIDKSEYNRIVNRWGNQDFKDLHRDYHSIDGDMFYANFPGGDENRFILTTTHRYKNKVAATANVFDFEEVDPDEWELFEYPDNGWSIDSPHHMGETGLTRQEGRRIALFNTRWGKAKQIRVWFLIFQDKTLDSGYAQEAYWKGGNKNELVICLGVDESRKIQWGHVFSWTDRESFKIELRNQINSMKGEELSINPTMDWLDSNIGKWERKSFEDFDYIDVPSPWWAVMINYIITVLCSIGVIYFAVMNDFTEEDPDGNSYTDTKWL